MAGRRMCLFFPNCRVLGVTCASLVGPPALASITDPARERAWPWGHWTPGFSRESGSPHLPLGPENRPTSLSWACPMAWGECSLSE